jgi:hypothetical protein
MSVRRVVLFDADGCMLRGREENKEVTATSDGMYVEVGKRSTVEDAMAPLGFNKYVWDMEEKALARTDVRETVYASGSRRTGPFYDLVNACSNETPLFVSFLEALSHREGITFQKDHLDDLFVDGGAYYDDFLAVITAFNNTYVTEPLSGEPLTAESILLSRDVDLIKGFKGFMCDKLKAKNPKYMNRNSCSRDKTKFSLLYWRIHQQAKIAKAHGDTLELTLVDDREDILRELTGFFKQYPKLLPKNTTLSFVHHRSDNNLDNGFSSREVCEPVVGQGDIDSTPDNTVRILERSLFSGDVCKRGETLLDKKLLNRFLCLLHHNVKAVKGDGPWLFAPDIPKPNRDDSLFLKALMKQVLPHKSYATALRAGLMTTPCTRSIERPVAEAEGGINPSCSIV